MQPILPIRFADSEADTVNPYASLKPPVTPDEKQEAVDEYYASLDHLAKLYGFTPRDCRHLDYPVNIGLSYYSACQQLKGIAPDVSLLIMADDENIKPTHRATLVTIQERTDGYLVNVPIRPYHLMMREPRKHRYRLGLLDSIFAFLYRKVHFPYCDESSYFDQVLTYEDETCEEYTYLSKTATEKEKAEWEADPEVQGAWETKKDIAHIRKMTKRCKKRFDNPHHLDMFSTRVAQFVAQPGHPYDDNLLQVAIRLLELDNQFPHLDFKTAVNSHHIQVRKHEEGTVFVDMTNTFVWSSLSDRYSLYRQHLDDEFNSGASEEFVKSVQIFDRPQTQDIHPDQQEYYKELLEALSDLSDILDRYEVYDPTMLTNIIPTDAATPAA